MSNIVEKPVVFYHHGRGKWFLPVKVEDGQCKGCYFWNNRRGHVCDNPVDSRPNSAGLRWPRCVVNGEVYKEYK